MSMMELFCENSQQLKAVNNFCKDALLKMFYSVLDRYLGLVAYRLMHLVHIP